MFLLPFLHYFKPFWARILLALAAAMLVGVLTAAPVVIIREAIYIFVAGGAARGEDLNEMGDLSHLIKTESKSETQHKELKPKWDRQLTAFAGRAWTVP